jgi:hypothetical protein
MLTIALGPPPRQCPFCHALGVVVVQTFVVRDSRVRYYGCRRCGRRPPHNKRIVPLIYAARRKAA